ncbi:hypothetical protein MVEN_02504400 [Mycena venus]|uniref:Dienelactone hydrolase domain-containing protein n=1 Tax=Mycena venus TaxID=2733690 RepID=A0A8H6WSU1_9AGAR|nr:hypothetical protein MVEN_02504400 [Mycena venus]
MESATIAHPHCDGCFTGVKHSGEPVGNTVTIADIPTYVSEPPPSVATRSGPKKIVLFFSDVYGLFYLNNQLLQDYFAAQGFFVVGIDYFFGAPIQSHTEEGFDRNAWIMSSHAKALEIAPKWVEQVRKQYGTDGKYCAVAAFAHPGLLTEDHFKNLKHPLLMSCAESDFTFPTELRRRAEDILVENKAQYHIQVFSGVQHGFAVRGDMEKPNARWAKEESARGISAWFTRFSA